MRNKINEITVTTRNPSGAPGDMGSCETGFYRVDDDLLTLVDGGGKEVRSANGERITAHLRGGDSVRTVASRLVLARWRSERDASETVPGFNRRLSYGPSGLA